MMQEIVGLGEEMIQQSVKREREGNESTQGKKALYLFYPLSLSFPPTLHTS
jgi:hypothetical protein